MPAGTEDTVLAIGSCSGRTCDKGASLGLNTCTPGWNLFSEPGAADPALTHKASSKLRERTTVNAALLGMADGVAHLVCRMDERRLHDGHYLMLCTVLHAYVRPRYWNGNGLVATPGLPPLLTFLGSKKFAYMSAPTAGDASEAAAAEPEVEGDGMCSLAVPETLASPHGAHA